MPQGAGKSLDESPAAGRAGFVDLDALDMPISDENGLHILPADIQDESHLRVKGARRPVVGQCLHNALVAAKSRPDQILAIPGHRAAGDSRRPASPANNWRSFSSPSWTAWMGLPSLLCVVLEEQPPALIDQRQLGGGRARIRSPGSNPSHLLDIHPFDLVPVSAPSPSCGIPAGFRKEVASSRPSLDRACRVAVDPVDQPCERKRLCAPVSRPAARAAPRAESSSACSTSSQSPGERSKGLHKCLLNTGEESQRTAGKKHLGLTRWPRARVASVWNTTALKIDAAISSRGVSRLSRFCTSVLANTPQREAIG